MMAKSALLVGATGLIGNQLLELLLNDGRYDSVRVVTRKALERHHPRLQAIVVEFDQLSTLGEQLRADDVFCCLGTTIRKAKTQDAFKKVDYEYPLAVAQLCFAHGAQQYFLVSALGASATSSIFYNRVKGEVENAIAKVGFKSLHIFRPSLLVGPRQEARSGEDAAKVFYKIFGFLFPAKYKAIDSVKVARAMLAFAKREEKGIFYHESAELQNY